MLDLATGVVKTEQTSNAGPDLDARYFRPSNAAKYWLNRYFALTIWRHVETVNNKKPLRRNRRFSWEDVLKSMQGKKAIPQPNWLKLPKKSAVTRLAVIHVRCTPPSGQDIGRIMDKENWQHVARAIANVNVAVERRRQASLPTTLEPFSHVLLYGDFSYGEAATKRLEVLGELSKCKTKVSVGFISRPWHHESAPEDDEEINEFWKKFRDADFDHLPVQVKSLAIWVALCNRYSPDVCVIGHRSGFVEAAAFIGIPVFYLNNERKDITVAGSPDIPGRGELLWTPVKAPSHDRLREASDVMNTLIPIESFGDPSNIRAIPAQTSNKTQEPDSTQSGSAKPKILRPMKEYEHELAAALFLFMCCVPEENRSVNGRVTPGDKPAWMNRVSIMHNERKAGEQSVEGASTKQLRSGREWLKNNYKGVHDEFRSWR